MSPLNHLQTRATEEEFQSVAETSNQPQGPSTKEWKKKMRYMCTMDYLLSHKKDEIISLAVTWMDLEIIILGEVSNTEKNNL